MNRLASRLLELVDARTETTSDSDGAYGALPLVAPPPARAGVDSGTSDAMLLPLALPDIRSCYRPLACGGFVPRASALQPTHHDRLASGAA